MCHFIKCFGKIKQNDIYLIFPGAQLAGDALDGGDQLRFAKIVSEYDQEIPQSQTANNPKAPGGRATQPSQDTKVVEWLFLAMPWGCLRFVIVIFPDHTHLLFLGHCLATPTTGS